MTPPEEEDAAPGAEPEGTVEAALASTPASKAFLSVAQTAALAVQDAADNLRQVSTLSTTALGAAMAQFLATGDPVYLQAIAASQGMVSRAAEDFRVIGDAAADVLRRFPRR